MLKTHSVTSGFTDFKIMKGDQALIATFHRKYLYNGENPHFINTVKEKAEERTPAN